MCDVHTQVCREKEREGEHAMAGNNEGAEFSTKVERGSLDAGDKASCAVGQVKEALEYKWAFSSSQKDTEVESYGSSSKLLADAGPNGGEQKKAMAKLGYSIPAAEEVAGVYAQKNVVSDESYGSGRFLLSCSMASTRVKKKRRSRATSKAPIKVFSTDASNFMAMVHKLTGIPTNAFPFYSPPPPSASSKLSPYTQVSSFGFLDCLQHAVFSGAELEWYA